MGFKVKGKIILMVILLFFVNIIIWVSYDIYQTRKDDCFITDQIKFLDTATVDNEGYLLVRIISGWHDKIEFLELFPHDVLFDCGKPNKESLHAVDIDYGPEGEARLQWPVKFEIKNKEIIIHYTKDKTKQLPIIDIPVVWHQSSGDATHDEH